MARARRRRLVILVAMLAFWPACEVLLRLKGFAYPPFELPIHIWNAGEDYQLNDEAGLHRFDRDHFWLPREDAPIGFAPGEHVSAEGFRGQDPDPRAAYRVLVLGDSSTFGFGIRDEETFARRLENELDRLLRAEESAGRPEPAERVVQVVNGGVIGSTVWQGLARYRAVAARWKPHLVIEVFAGMNEHVPTFDLDDKEKSSWLRERETLGYRLRRFPRRHLRVVQLGFWLLDESRGGRDAILLESMTAVLERRKELQQFTELPDYKKRVGPGDFVDALRQLHEWSSEDGATLVCVRAARTAGGEARRKPVRAYDAALLDFTERDGVTLVDAQAYFQGLVATGTEERDLFLDEVHPTPLGHRHMAELLLDVVGPLALRAH